MTISSKMSGKMTGSTAAALLDIHELLARKDEEEAKEKGTDKGSKNKTKKHDTLNKETSSNGGQGKRTRKRKKEADSDDLEPESYKCGICNKEFLTKAGARSHEKYQHTKAKLFCTVCRKPFKFHYDLDRHMKTHTGVRPFECQDCDKTFVCKSSLMQHVRLKHIVGNIYNCTVCDKSFYTEADLKRHAAVHFDNKPFKCTKCMKTFTCKSSLNLHLRNHGEKKFACSYCNMHFHVQSDLKRHETVHTGVRPWRCRICNKGYSCKSTLSVHIKQLHTDSPTADMYIHDKDGKASNPAQPEKNTGGSLKTESDTDSDEDTSDNNSDDDTDMESSISSSEIQEEQDDIDISDMDEITGISSEIKKQPKKVHRSTTGKASNSNSALISEPRMNIETSEESESEESTVDPYEAIDALNKETRTDSDVIPVALYLSQKRGRKPDIVRKLEISGQCVLLFKP